MTKSRIPLSEVIATISSELFAADAAARARGRATMQFEECEIEFAVETTEEGTGGIKVWVLQFGAGKKFAESNKIRVKFKKLPYGLVAAATPDSPAPALEAARRPR